MAQAEIGIIGGSGLYQMKGLTDLHEVALDTPFGKPSDSFMLGTLAGRKVAFLARHGRGHRIMPSELNFRANIHGMKQLGVEPASAEVSMIPQNYVKLEGKPAQQMVKLMEALDDHDDVQHVWSNFDISEKEIEASLA